MASQAIQVFYVDDPKESDWSVVVKTKPRDFYDVMDDNDELNIDDYYATPNLDDPILDNQELQRRTDVRGVYVNKILPLHEVDDAILEEDDLDEDDDDVTDSDDDISC